MMAFIGVRGCDSMLRGPGREDDFANRCEIGIAQLGGHAVVLVKGSRSSRMENVVNALVEKV